MHVFDVLTYHSTFITCNFTQQEPLTEVTIIKAADCDTYNFLEALLILLVSENKLIKFHKNMLQKCYEKYRKYYKLYFGVPQVDYMLDLLRIGNYSWNMELCKIAVNITIYKSCVTA